MEHRQVVVQDFVGVELAAPMQLNDIQAYNEANGLRRITDTEAFDRLRTLVREFAKYNVDSVIHIHGVQTNEFGSGLIYTVFNTNTGESTQVRNWEWWTDEGESAFNTGSVLVFLR